MTNLIIINVIMLYCRLIKLILNLHQKYNINVIHKYNLSLLEIIEKHPNRTS